VTEKTEKKRIKSSALPWFITSRLNANERAGLSEVDQACLALEADGLPCPMNVNHEQWIRENLSYICAKYQEKYPKPAHQTPSNRQSKKQRKKQRLAARATQNPAKQLTVKVAGINVTTDAFLETYEWRRLRMEALKKYGPKCMCCGATPATGAVMNVDHIKPRKLFPALAMDLNNLQVLCHECNHGKGNWDQTDWRAKKVS